MKELGSKTINTERLDLKAQTMKEQKRLWEILMMPEVRRLYLVVPKKLKNKLLLWELQKTFYEEKIKYANDADVYDWSIFLKDSDICIGKIDFHKIDGEDGNIKDVGWYIDPHYQCNGYATEAAEAVLEYIFEEVGIEAIKTSVAISNIASWKVMEKIGFKRLPFTKFVNYTFVDEQVENYQYEITKEEYFELNY